MIREIKELYQTSLPGKNNIFHLFHSLS